MGGAAELVDLSEYYSGDGITDFDCLILGSPSFYDDGPDGLSFDWDEALLDLQNADLSGKKVAIFGFGDPVGYSEWFCDSMGRIYEIVKASGATIVGLTENKGYADFDGSKALITGSTFVGLCLDNDNQPELMTNA